MSTLRDRILDWVFGLRPPTEDRGDPVRDAVRRAQFLKVRAAEAGLSVSDTKAIDDAAALLADTGKLSGAAEQAFFEAYGTLRQRTVDLSKRPLNRLEYPFEESLEDSELLLKYAAESGRDVPKEVASAIIGARTAFKGNKITDEIRAGFYQNYSALSKQLRDVTAQTIRSCSQPATRWRLNRDQFLAVTLAVLVAIFSVITFVGDARSKLIAENIAAENALATRLRADLTPTSSTATIDKRYADDPCAWLTEPPGPTELKVTQAGDIAGLQQFAAVMREIRSRAIKLNDLVSRVPLLRTFECDPFLNDPSPPKACQTTTPRKDTGELEKALQLNPSVANYTAEVLCKIKSYQSIRDFADNVNANYTAFVGAFTSFALPILYALLGAYAFRLRTFSDTIRKQTYHPSYADSARTITALIAGTICGLFNPAQGLSLSPLAIAFLVGYGVEIFFRLLDNLTAALGAPNAPRSGPAAGAPTVPSR